MLPGAAAEKQDGTEHGRVRVSDCLSYPVAAILHEFAAMDRTFFIIG